MKNRFNNALKLAAAALLVTAATAGAQSAEELLNPDPQDWPAVGRTVDGQRFSPLDQINTENVDQLRLDWVLPIPFTGSVQLTPAVYDGVMYINMPTGVLAVDATNGQTIWNYSPDQEAGGPGYTHRGSVVVFDSMILHSRNDGYVVALDIDSGEEIWANKVSDGAVANGFNAGPIFADGKIVVGPAGADSGGNPGQIFALDAYTGEIVWTFDVIPGPEDEEAYATWDPKPTGEVGYGGGAAWSPGAYDPVTRTVVYGTGQPTPWDRFYIREGSHDLYTNSFVGLDVDTGEIKWYHQVIPADEWDLDQHPTPIIADIEVDGTDHRAAILMTTTGFVVTIDLETGEFINGFGMTDEPTVHTGYEADGTPIIDDSYRYDESGDQRLVCPFRWVNYELATFNPENGLLYRPNSNECWDLIVYALDDDWQPGQAAYNFDGPYIYDRHDHVGAVSAINPATGEVVWEYTTGYAHRAGAVATAGGLVFAPFADRTFRAFDAETGEVLWEQLVTSTTNGNPISYAVDGVQYVAVPIGGSGGAGQAGLPPVVAGPPTMFVFSLPESAR